MRATSGRNGRNARSSMPEYNVWSCMKARCCSPRHSAYNYYGARGIRVCDEWLASFDAFLADMGPRPTDKHTLDRIDGDGNYEPSNCRWATRAQQSQNRKRREPLYPPYPEAAKVAV